MYRTVLSIVGHDVLELFGDTGTGKTTFAFALAIGALQEGKKVIYIDTERNIDEHLINRLKVLGLEYHYFTSISDVLNFLNNRPKADVYILDSIGMPALRHFAKANAKEKGDMLLKAIAISGLLKDLSRENNALVLITNQPESEFGKGVGVDRAPFGDKHVFDIKEIWKTEVVEKAPDKTVTRITAWRSRRFGKGKLLARMEISNEGVKIAFTKERGKSGIEAMLEKVVGNGAGQDGESA